MGESRTTVGQRQEGSCVDQVEFHVSSDPKMLKIIRSGISYLCELAGFSTQQQNQTALAVDEACANIIKYAYDGRHDQQIIVKARLLENGIEIVLRDFGKKAKPAKIKPRDLDDIRPGGLGVHFIRSIMDVVSYATSANDGNKLTLTKFRVPKSSKAREKES